jgi:hypothetical protein
MTASYSKLFLLLTTISFMLAACNTVCSTKKVGCPGFSDPHFTAWFPYYTNQILIFKNQTGDSIKYPISNIEPSGRYDAIVGGLFGRSATSCSTSVYITAIPDSINQSGFVVQYYVDTPFSGQDVRKYLQIVAQNANWNAGALYKDSIGNVSNSYTPTTIATTNYQVTLNNGLIIDTLVTLTNDTTVDHTSRFYKVFIQKRKGIIGFEKYPSHQQWFLQ